MLLSVGRIQQSGVFGNDNDILRRIAYVETRDGTLSGTFREGYNGGIWAANEDAFRSTQNTDAFAQLPAMIEQIEELLQINWLDAEWSDLRKPLYSALAARLIIFNAPTPVPPPDDLAGQAQFWVEYYNRNGTLSPPQLAWKASFEHLLLGCMCNLITLIGEFSLTYCGIVFVSHAGEGKGCYRLH